MKTRLELFHAFVIEQFCGQEVSSGEISSRMTKNLGVKIKDYFGCKLGKIEDNGGFNELFHIQRGENGMIKLKANMPPRVSYVGKELYGQMFTASLRKANVRDGMQSAFTNVSVFDGPYLEALFGGSEFPDGSFMIDYLDEIKDFQKVFM